MFPRAGSATPQLEIFPFNLLFGVELPRLEETWAAWLGGFEKFQDGFVTYCLF